jgi:hypothetical protein
MASTATKYAGDIYYEILENEAQDSDYPDWGFFTKYNVYKDLSNCFAELGYLGRAFVEKFDS